MEAVVLVGRALAGRKTKRVLGASAAEKEAGGEHREEEAEAMVMLTAGRGGRTGDLALS